MSGTYALRELARADLEAIWVYTVEQWGVEQADRYLQGFFDCFDELAANPWLGRERDDVKAGYRSFPQGRHMVFYLVASEGIEMIGIVHQSADVDAYLVGPAAEKVCPAETPHGPFCGRDYMLRQVTWARACSEFPASQHVNQATDGPSIPVSLKLPLFCLYFVRN